MDNIRVVSNTRLSECAYSQLRLYRYSVHSNRVLNLHSIQVSCYLTACERMTDKLRRDFVKAVLRQDVAWFDQSHSGTLASKLFELVISIDRSLLQYPLTVTSRECEKERETKSPFSFNTQLSS